MANLPFYFPVVFCFGCHLLQFMSLLTPSVIQTSLCVFYFLVLFSIISPCLLSLLVLLSIFWSDLPVCENTSKGTALFTFCTLFLPVEKIKYLLPRSPPEHHLLVGQTRKLPSFLL